MANWRLRLSLCLYCSFAAIPQAVASETPPAVQGIWANLIGQAETLGLPTRFLRAIPPDFVTLEFDDLRAFAAEYHPAEHRMVLNRTLSFNAAAGSLRPLASLSHRELGTLYHELFHAYLDYLLSARDQTALGPQDFRLLALARDQQQCRYQIVTIAPVVQRKSATETRFLTERESWEALNETWAVFVGWAVWTELELGGGKGRKGFRLGENWMKRLTQADRDGDLIGYYEPEGQAERAVARKRYLAHAHRITPREVRRLLEVVFGETAEGAQRLSKGMEQGRAPSKDSVPCRE
ncbi:MAG: hypothetical protein AB1411_00590 [Nitrospirota bacterium]